MDFIVDDSLLTTLSVKLVIKYNKTIQIYVNLSIFFLTHNNYVFQYPLKTCIRCSILHITESIVAYT